MIDMLLYIAIYKEKIHILLWVGWKNPVFMLPYQIYNNLDLVYSRAAKLLLLPFRNWQKNIQSNSKSNDVDTLTESVEDA